MFKRPIATRLTPVPAYDALVHDANIEQLQNIANPVAASEVKEHKNHHGYVLQQPPLDPEWISTNCELPDLIPIAIRLQYRSGAFPSTEAIEQGQAQYKALLSDSAASSSDVKLANDSIRPLLFNTTIDVDLDDVWANSLRDYIRLQPSGCDEYVSRCLANSPRVPGSIFGTDANSLDHILLLLKSCRTKNSKGDATLVNIGIQLVNIVAIQAWHVINGRFLVYNPVAALPNGGEANIPSSAVLFDHSKPPSLVMSYRQRDFVPHPLLYGLIRDTLKPPSQRGKRVKTPQKMDASADGKGQKPGKAKPKQESKTKKPWDPDSLHVDESDLQTAASHSSLTTFIFLVLRCVAEIAAEHGLPQLFNMRDSLKWCRDQLGKNKALFLDTMHFREMPVQDTLERFNDFSRQLFGANNVAGRLMTSPPGRWCKARNNGSLYITPLTWPADNPYAVHLPQFYFHLSHSAVLPAIPVPPVDDKTGEVSTNAILGTLVWALSLHTGSTMRKAILAAIREHVTGEETKKTKRAQRKRSADNDSDADEEEEPAREHVTQVKRRRVGKKGDTKAVSVAHKTRHSSLLSSHFGKFRPVLSPIRRRYCCVLGPDEVLYASPPATVFVQDCVNEGVFADESSVFMLSPTIIRCLQLQGWQRNAHLGFILLCIGTDNTARVLEEMKACAEGKKQCAPHYAAVIPQIIDDLQSGNLIPADGEPPTPTLYMLYLVIGSVVQYEADAVVTLMAMIDVQRQQSISPAQFCGAITASYEAYLDDLRQLLDGADDKLGGIYHLLHNVMRKQWSRLSHVALLAMRSAEQKISGVGFGILSLSAMEKFVEDAKTANGWAFAYESQPDPPPEDPARSDLWSQLAMALVNRQLPPAAELNGILVLKRHSGNSNSSDQQIVVATATELFVDMLERSHLAVVVPSLQYIALKCPAPAIMHQSTGGAKIAFGALPAPKVRSATESAMMELATKHTASIGDLVSSADFIRDIDAMTDVPDKLKPALQFLFLSAPSGQRTPRMFETVGRLMGNFGRNPADAAQQLLVQEAGGLVNSAKQKTKGHIQHVQVGSRDVPFFVTAADSTFQPLNPNVMVDGQRLLQLCRSGSETTAFWQCLQSFIASMIDTSVLRETGMGKPRVISVPIIEAAYIRLAADIDCPIGYTLRPPSDRLMDVLQYLWLSMPESPSRTLFLKILADTAVATKSDPRFASSPDLQTFVHRLKAKVAEFEAWRPGRSESKQQQPQQPQQQMVASTALMHPHAIRQLPPPFGDNTSGMTSSSHSNGSSSSSSHNGTGSRAQDMDTNGNDGAAPMRTGNDKNGDDEDYDELL